MGRETIASDRIKTYFDKNPERMAKLEQMSQSAYQKEQAGQDFDKVEIRLNYNDQYQSFWVDRGDLAKTFQSDLALRATSGNKVESPTNEAILKEVGVLGERTITEDGTEVDKQTIAREPVKIGNDNGQASEPPAKVKKQENIQNPTVIKTAREEAARAVASAGVSALATA